MRATRRRQDLLELLRNRPMTAAEAADALGASLRTVYRDVAVLRQDGHTIAAEGGHGGGLRLDPASRPRPVRLEADEILGLAMAIAALEARPGLPFSDAARRALGRLLDALPRVRALQVRDLLRRLVVGEPADPQGGPVGPVTAGLITDFELAFAKQRVLVLDYLDQHGARSSRQVEPMALLVRLPIWYIAAWDRGRDTRRLFRMDRVQRSEVLAAGFTPRPFFPPPDAVCPDLAWLVPAR